MQMLRSFLFLPLLDQTRAVHGRKFLHGTFRGFPHTTTPSSECSGWRFDRHKLVSWFNSTWKRIPFMLCHNEPAILVVYSSFPWTTVSQSSTGTARAEWLSFVSSVGAVCIRFGDSEWTIGAAKRWLFLFPRTPQRQLVCWWMVIVGWTSCVTDSDWTTTRQVTLTILTVNHHHHHHHHHPIQFIVQSTATILLPIIYPFTHNQSTP